MQTGYEPLNTLKPVGEGLWLIDGPAVIHRRLPIPTRASVALLESGLWVHSPTELTQGLQAELEALGPVAHLALSSTIASGHMTAWQAAYPEARVWTPENLTQGSPWPGEIDQHRVAGSRNAQNVVFFHRAAQTLIVGDLIANFETEKLPAWVRPFIWFAQTDHPNGGMPPPLRRAYKDREALADSVEAMINWRPRRLLLSHGRWYKRDAVGELERIFRKVLRERLWMKAMDDIEARDK